MQTFTGWQYLCIDVANHAGFDKLLFNERIEWVNINLDILESLSDKADKKPLYIKAVMALRKAQKGIPTGHLVEWDAVCSGTQIMSALTGCIEGSINTGLIDPNTRADAYSTLTKTMNEILGGGFSVSRADAKSAYMKSMYGSKKVPKEIFGEDTEELNAFYQAVNIVSPGAWTLLQELLAAWQPWTLVHEWQLPDGFDARVKVMQKKEISIEVDELDHSRFSYTYYENQGEENGLSLVANCIHSIDGFLLREMHRRCNYDPAVLAVAGSAIASELELRELGFAEQVEGAEGKLQYYIEQYERSAMASVVILSWIKDGHQTQHLSTEHLKQLGAIVKGMGAYTSFEVVTIHDCFKIHPNNANHVRWQYKEIMAELAESEILGDILSQIHGTKGTYTKLSNDLGEKIRGSNYALS